MALKLWSSLPIGEGEARLGGKTKDALDAVEPIGWDVRCAGCRLGFRLLYTLDEWGKMSNAFFPVIGEVVYPEP